MTRQDHLNRYTTVISNIVTIFVIITSLTACTSSEMLDDVLAEDPLMVLPLLSNEDIPNDLSAFGQFHSEEVFVFHDDASAVGFYQVVEQGLCVQQIADNTSAWRAFLDTGTEHITPVIAAYFQWYETNYPDDLSWGLAPCPTRTALSDTDLARYGELLGNSHFRFHDLSSAYNFWERLSGDGQACHWQDRILSSGRPKYGLDQALHTLRNWQRAGVVSLDNGYCLSNPVADGSMPSTTLLALSP